MNPEPNFEQEVRGYLTGFALALVLTLTPFAMVAWAALPTPVVLLFVAICAVLQVFVQLRYFLHIDLSRQKREDLLLILFSGLLLAIMAGGTIWIMANLAHRMH